MTRKNLPKEIIETRFSNLAGDCNFLFRVECVEYVKDFGQEEAPRLGVGLE